MKLLLQVTFEGLIPLYDSDLDEKKKLSMGSIVSAEIRRPRNYKFHKKFFALLRLTSDNMPHTIEDKYQIYNPEDLRFAIMMDLGRFTVVKTAGYEFPKPDSISFESMDEDEFNILYRQVVSIILTKYLPGIRNEDIEQEIHNFI